MAKDRTNKEQVRLNKIQREKRREVKTPAPSLRKKKDLDFEKPAHDDEMGWLKTYLLEAFKQPFGKVHHEIKDGFNHALLTGCNVEILAPRGTGKSTIINGLALRALLECQTPFPVVIPWDADARKRALRFWKNQLCFNERLHRDYPEATAVFKESRGIGNRLTALTQGNEATGAMLAISEGIIVLPHGLGAIGSSTINGNPRGMNYSSIDGSVIRPTLAIIDDPQDRETAKSQKLVGDTIEIIDGDIAGMAGPDSRMPIIMSATIVENNDVAEYYANNPNWKCIRVSQIENWPDGWKDKDSKCKELWDKWDRIRVEENDAAAVAFYLANKLQMVKGMSVSWESRYDAKRGQPDALYSAMYDFHSMGESSFMAERQNSPVKKDVSIYTLTTAVIQSRTDETRKPMEIPSWSVLRVAATDCNPSYALTSAITAFGKDQTAAVLWYGLFKDAPLPIKQDIPARQQDAMLFEALVAHGKQLAQTSCRPDAWTVDASGAAFDTVLRFAEKSLQLCGLQCIPSTGRSSSKYNPFVKSRIETPKEQSVLCRDPQKGKWIAWDADHWKEVAQKAWLGSIGAPGSCSLFAGNHRDFAEQICREQLAGKADIAGKMIYRWLTVPGHPHDYNDVMAMIYMLASRMGVGSTNFEQKQKQRVAVHISRPQQWR